MGKTLKRFSFILAVILGSASPVFAQAPSCSTNTNSTTYFAYESGASGYHLPPGANVSLSYYNACRVLLNSTQKMIFVPTNSNLEWTQFLAHLPTGVTVSNCETPSWTVGGWGACTASGPCGPTGGTQTRSVSCSLYDCSTGAALSPTTTENSSCIDKATINPGDDVSPVDGVPDSTQSCAVACPPAPPVTCPAQTMTWNVSGLSCSGDVSITSATGSTTATSTTPGGSATFACSATGTWGAATGATCATPMCYSKSIGFGPVNGCDNSVNFYWQYADCTAAHGAGGPCDHAPFTSPNCKAITTANDPNAAADCAEAGDTPATVACNSGSSWLYNGTNWDDYGDPNWNHPGGGPQGGPFPRTTTMTGVPPLPSGTTVTGIKVTMATSMVCTTPAPSCNWIRTASNDYDPRHSSNRYWAVIDALYGPREAFACTANPTVGCTPGQLFNDGAGTVYCAMDLGTPTIASPDPATYYNGYTPMGASLSTSGCSSLNSGQVVDEVMAYECTNSYPKVGKVTCTCAGGTPDTPAATYTWGVYQCDSSGETGNTCNKATTGGACSTSIGNGYYPTQNQGGKNESNASFTADPVNLYCSTPASCSSLPSQCTARAGQCAEQVVTWTASGLTCTTQLPRADNATSQTAYDLTGSTFGSASFTCSNGTWSSATGATCATALPAHYARWVAPAAPGVIYNGNSMHYTSGQQYADGVGHCSASETVGAPCQSGLHPRDQCYTSTFQSGPLTPMAVYGLNCVYQ